MLPFRSRNVPLNTSAFLHITNRTTSAVSYQHHTFRCWKKAEHTSASNLSDAIQEWQGEALRVKAEASKTQGAVLLNKARFQELPRG